MYDTFDLVVQRRAKSQAKQIKIFAKNNVELICEVPSLKNLVDSI
jgi:hypothetical protein